MLTTIKVFTVLPNSACVGRLCENKEHPELLQQTSKFFFQMNAQVYSVPGQTEGRRKSFLEWKSIDLS